MYINQQATIQSNTQKDSSFTDYHKYLLLIQFFQFCNNFNQLIDMQSPKHQQSKQDYNLQAIISKMLLEKQYRCGNCENCMFEKLRCKRAIQNKLSLSPIRSTYLASYKQEKYINNQKINIPSNQKISSMIISDSAYRNQFSNRQMDQTEVPIKPRNNIKLGGPQYFSSNYKESFPQLNRSPVKQEKIVNPQCWPTIQQLKMSGSSSYRQSYKATNLHVVSPIKRQGSLRVNGSFIGETSYKNEYLPYIAIKKTQSLKPYIKYEPSRSKSISSTYKAEFLSHNSRDRKKFFGTID